jgi:hypothetical protein
MAMLRLLIVALAFGLTAACSSVRETQPPRSAMEQLLISGAVDDALKRLQLDIPADRKIWVDASAFESYDQKYAIGAIKEQLLRLGARLVADRASADTVVEIRSGALSIEDSGSLIGLPGATLPIPLAGNVTTPQVPLLKKDKSIGVAKLALTAYDAKTGALEPYSPSAPIYGFSTRTRFDSLFYGWDESDVQPPEADQK